MENRNIPTLDEFFVTFNNVKSPEELANDYLIVRDDKNQYIGSRIKDAYVAGYKVAAETIELMYKTHHKSNEQN